MESQNFLLDISQRELLEDPKELSFSKDIVHKEDIIFSNERNKKSVFSKQKSLAADINNTERKINNELLDENDKLHSRTKTEPNVNEFYKEFKK